MKIVHVSQYNLSVTLSDQKPHTVVDCATRYKDRLIAAMDEKVITNTGGTINKEAPHKMAGKGWRGAMR